jgi:zinc protease
MIKKILAAVLIVAVAACTPKAGEKASASKVPTGTAPQIPIPTGDVRKNAPKAGPAPTIQIGKAETFKLDNGLQVIVVENHKLPKVSFRVFVDYKPVLERDAAGYVDMTGELLSKGTTNRTKVQLDESVDFLGASLSSDANGASASCLSKHSEKVLELLSDVVLNPAFTQDEFDKAKRRSESGLASQKDDANAIAGNVGSRLRYGAKHPYGEFMTVESLNKITLEQVKKHYSTFFKPNVAYFVVVGDITKSKAEQYAKKYFGKWQQGDVPVTNYVRPRAPESAQVDFVHKPGAVQSVINITYPVDLAPHTTESIKARVMNAVLGGYFNSRVNANLREGHGWTYGARTSLRPDELIGSFTASASVRNNVTDSSVVEFLKEMERMRTEKVPEKELQVVKNVLTGQFSQSLEEPGTVADFALNTARFKLPANYYEQYLSVLQGVNGDEIQQLAQKYIRPGNAHILVVGNRDDVSDRLKPFAKDGKINFYDAFAQPVKNINTNIPPGVTAQSIIEDYINAVGGATKIAAISDVQTTVTMQTRGPEITVKQAQKGGTKLMQDMLMRNQSMGKTILDGDRAVQTGAGAAKRDITGDELQGLKEQALVVKEVAYKQWGYTMEIKGIEEVEGKAAYVIEVTRPGGSKFTQYHDVATNMKVREIMAQKGADGGETIVTNDFADYREISGVKLPYSSTTSGVFPTPIKATVTELKVNTGMDDSVFKMD